MPTSEEMITQLQRLTPSLRRYGRAMLRDGDDADDLVQDVLERALTRWHSRRQTASLRPWLFAILHNLALDRLRRVARRGVNEPLETVPEARLGTPATQESALEQRRLLELVALLPDEQRSVLLLISVEELSYAEAAAVLDIPQGTVMSRLARARERLRRMMEGERQTDKPSLRIVP